MPPEQHHHVGQTVGVTAVLLNKWVMVGHGGLSEWHYDLSGPQRNDVVIEATRMTSAASRLDPLLNNGVDVDGWRATAGFRMVDLSLASRAGQDGVEVRFYGEDEGWRHYRVIGDWGATTLRYSKADRPWHLLGIVSGVLVDIATAEGWPLPTLQAPRSD